ncbi:hypothetical protein [Thioalkalivibrio sp. HK1]|uniref:hypothetical protein n=1 Tax=Thioalkalivibrio sp. HK1 TaxID=1469245 RepID=UPI00057201FF|nr:hypothetical protein [Thioalkalivibrio sp. HK1]
MSEIKLFVATSTIVQEISGKTANLERDIQTLFENHLDTLLNIRFICSEFKAGDGRIDTLGLDEKNNPVIIEYKRNMTSHSINQGLSYRNWLVRHKKDFYFEVFSRIDKKTADLIEWSAPRLICIAADFGKYDVGASNEISNIDLIKYRKYGNELMLLEFMNRPPSNNDSTKTKRSKIELPSINQRRVESIPSKQKMTRDKTHAEHHAEMDPEQAGRYRVLEDFLQSLGTDIVQSRKVKIEVFSRNKKKFASLQLMNRRRQIYVSLSLDPKWDIPELEDGFTRDLTGKGHWGIGKLQVIIGSDRDIERAKPLIHRAYDKAYRR